MKPFEFMSAVFVNYRPHKDKSVSLTFETPEISGEELAVLHESHGQICRLIVAPIECQGYDEVVTIDRQAGEQTPSERQYKAIYALYMNLVERGKIDSKTQTFQTYYNRCIDASIKTITDKIENNI